MRKSWTVLFLPVACLWAAGPASAADTVAPGGIGRILLEAAPPDFQAFPPGTESVRVQFTARRAGDVHRITWEFERNRGQGSLIPRHGDVDRGDEKDPSAVFPASPLAEGPLRSLHSLLEGFHRRDVPQILRYLPASARESFNEDPTEVRERIDALEKVLGATLPEWGAASLPRLGAVGKGIRELELRYRYPGESEGTPGVFTVKIRWVVKQAEDDHWTVEEFEPSFRESEEEEVGAEGRVALRGLRERLAVFAPPDVGAFPEKTVEVKARGWGRVEGKLYEIRANLERRGPEKPLFLEGYGVKPREILRKDHRVPSVPPPEGPLVSARRALTAFEAWDMETVLRYMPPKAREAFQEMGVEKLREQMEREGRERGFDPLKKTLANLPKWFDERGIWAGLEVEFVFPGRRRKPGEEGEEEKGTFEMRFELYVPEARAENWLVDDLDTDFDSD
ncbi:MAG: hypothetical protein ACYTHM_25590 [Planctomycetota bacterium]|jgi:hypothetical protein